MVKIYDRRATDLPINAIVASVIVPDPLEAGANVMVVRSIRTDPFGRMAAHRQIDLVQYAAGREWQIFYERSEIGGARGIDPTQIAVDGGRYKEPDLDPLSKALAKLRLAHEVLQAYEMSIVYDVLARNMSIGQIAAARSVTRGRATLSLMEHFRGALDTLAECYGLATRRA